jgi:16S rRNA (uracil1498-N3)-methyltransferase
LRQVRAFARQLLEPGARVRLGPQPSRHLTQVLRLQVGDAVVLFNGDGQDYHGTLVAARREAAEVDLDPTPPGDPEPAPVLEIELALGVSKGERMDFALQKAVELGVSALVPLFTKRGVVRLSGERLARRQQHWEGVVISACEQSGRRRVPVVQRAQALNDWLSDARGTALLLDHRAEQGLDQLAAPAGGRVSLLIGAEGGLTRAERDAAAVAGLVGVRLGPRILRTETAPLAAIAALQILWGDFRIGQGTR